MTLEEFKEEHDASPVEFVDFAILVSRITDAPDLSEAAVRFLEAYGQFEEVLEAYKLQVG